MIDTAVGTHTPTTALMELTLEQLIPLREAHVSYMGKLRAAREESEE